MASVSELLQRCLTRFASLISSADLSAHTHEVSLHSWGDELGRLRVWAANIGAHQTGQLSLDYRLRDASHVKGQIRKLLENVEELLMDLAEVLEEDRVNQSAPQVAEPEDLEYYSEGADGTTEIQQIHQSLMETITHLYQMSMVIRKPAHHDRLLGSNRQDAELFQFWAKQHASGKYPQADEYVIDRLSSAMAQQRAILKYRERHHAKLSKGIDSEEDGKSTILSETVVTSIFNEAHHLSSDTVSNDGISETSYAGSLLEGTGEGGPRIPSIPKNGADEKPFECPYCFYIITVSNDRAWAQHIFQDLMPYVCIFAECPTPNKLYESRRQWYTHLQHVHLLGPGRDSLYDCPICKQSSLPFTTFRRHVGGHLQELALFVLPRLAPDDDGTPVIDQENGAESVGDSLSETDLEPPLIIGDHDQQPSIPEERRPVDPPPDHFAQPAVPEYRPLPQTSYYPYAIEEYHRSPPPVVHHQQQSLYPRLDPPPALSADPTHPYASSPYVSYDNGPEYDPPLDDPRLRSRSRSRDRSQRPRARRRSSLSAQPPFRKQFIRISIDESEPQDQLQSEEIPQEVPRDSRREREAPSEHHHDVHPGSPDLRDRKRSISYNDSARQAQITIENSRSRRVQRSYYDDSGITAGRQDLEPESERYQAQRSGRTGTIPEPAYIVNKSTVSTGCDDDSQKSRSESRHGSDTGNEESVKGKNIISIRTGDTGRVQLNFNHDRVPKQYIMVGSSDSDRRGRLDRRELEEAPRRPREDGRSERASRRHRSK